MKTLTLLSALLCVIVCSFRADAVAGEISSDSELATLAGLAEPLGVTLRSDGVIVASWSGVAQPSLKMLARRPASSATLVFEDTFSGEASTLLNQQLWTNSGKAGLTGDGTAIFIKGWSNWANYHNGYVWDYTKTHTFEVSFRFPFYSGKFWDQNYILASRNYGGITHPRFELYPVGGKLQILYSSRANDNNPATTDDGQHFTNTDMLPYLHSNIQADFNIIQFVISKDERRCYVNNQLYCDITDCPIADPATPLNFALQGNDNVYMEADYARVYEGDASVDGQGSADWESRTPSIFPGANQAFLNFYDLFDSDEFAEVKIQLYDGTELIDEWSGLPLARADNGVSSRWDLFE